MTDFHQLHVTVEPGGMVFACEVDGCGRRLAIDRDGVYTVIDRGDHTARHSGSVGDVHLEAPGIAQR